MQFSIPFEKNNNKKQKNKTEKNEPSKSTTLQNYISKFPPLHPPQKAKTKVFEQSF